MSQDVCAFVEKLVYHKFRGGGRGGAGGWSGRSGGRSRRLVGRQWAGGRVRSGGWSGSVGFGRAVRAFGRLVGRAGGLAVGRSGPSVWPRARRARREGSSPLRPLTTRRRRRHPPELPDAPDLLPPEFSDPRTLADPMQHPEHPCHLGTSRTLRGRGTQRSRVFIAQAQYAKDCCDRILTFPGAPTCVVLARVVVIVCVCVRSHDRCYVLSPSCAPVVGQFCIRGLLLALQAQRGVAPTSNS